MTKDRALMAEYGRHRKVVYKYHLKNPKGKTGNVDHT